MAEQVDMPQLRKCVCMAGVTSRLHARFLKITLKPNDAAPLILKSMLQIEFSLSFFKTSHYTSARFWEGLVSCQVFNEIIQVCCHIFLFIVEEALPQQLSLAYLRM